MAEYDFFEITGLSFDPPEEKAKKIKALIEKAEKNLGGELGSVSQQAQRDEINGKLALLNRLKAEILSGDGKKVQPVFIELAEKKREAVKKRLVAAVRLEKRGKKELVVTNGKIKTLKKNTKLSKESIEDVYKSYGFTVIDIDPLAAMPKFPTNAEKIHSELEILRKSKDPNPNGADLTSVYDLYGFAAYLKGEPENSAEYHDMATKDISDLFDEYAKKNAMRNDPLGKLCVSIATAGKTNVFNKDANRKSYEQFLLFKKPELTELFAIMKDSVPSDLRDPGFADICIGQITEVFGDSNTALAIYNNEAGLRDDPYVPEKAFFAVKCAACQNISEYATLEEARRENKCRHCGKKLYKKCPHCGEMVLSSANRCPECSFTFANAGLFTKYISLAEVALKQGKLKEAREQLIRAKTADPNERIQTSALEKELESEEAKISEPLKELRILMESKRYQAAEAFLGDIVRQYPQISMAEQKKEITDVLSLCRAKFGKCRELDPQGKIRICLEILDLCNDFRQAEELLNNHPPKAVGKISARYDDEKKTVVVSWIKSGEQGVSYTLVRKEGSLEPLSINDGLVVMDNSREISYSDLSAVLGKQYVYAVFVKRKESISSPVSTVVRTLAGVSDIHYQQKANNLLVSWRLPANSQGAAVTCLSGGEICMAKENMHESAEIQNIRYGLPYVIQVAADYGSLGKSGIRQVSVTPTPIVESFRISASQTKDGSYNIGWSVSEKGVDIQIEVEGKVVQTARSEMKSCVLQFPANNHYRVQAKAFSEGRWMPAENELAINTYEPVHINHELSTITEKTKLAAGGMEHHIEIKLKLMDGIPGNIVAFYCIVKTKEPGATKAPWATENDASGNVDRIDYQTYQQWKEITKHITAHFEDAYYVTLFAVYKVDGKEVLSAPCRKKFNRPLEANIYWKTVRPFFGSAKVSIEIVANRMMNRRPEMILCASPQGKQLLSAEDSSAVELLKISEHTFEDPESRIEEDFDIIAAVKKNTKVFLFVIDSSNDESYSVRWAAGYNGKI